MNGKQLMHLRQNFAMICTHFNCFCTFVIVSNFYFKLSDKIMLQMQKLISCKHGKRCLSRKRWEIERNEYKICVTSIEKENSSTNFQ